MLKKYLFVVIILLLGIGVTSFFWWKSGLGPVSSNKTAIKFVVQKGWGAAQIGNKLEEKGLIKNALVFKIYMQISGKSSKIQAGEYSFFPSFSLPVLVEKLLKGPDLLWVTIPEGLRIEEIANKFASDLGKDDLNAFTKEFITKAKGKEGFLFPDSYLFPKNATVDKIISIMQNTFESKTFALKGDIPSGKTLEEIINMASLIERETKTDEERPMVAGVLLNRLNVGWSLQVDAAVQYAVANANCKSQNIGCKYWEPLSKADLQINSPYNTYKYRGLPPTPICGPGLSSIKAAIHPVASDYFFYLHDPLGQIHFARTIEEHNVNVRKYLGK